MIRQPGFSHISTASWWEKPWRPRLIASAQEVQPRAAGSGSEGRNGLRNTVEQRQIDGRSVSSADLRVRVSRVHTQPLRFNAAVYSLRHSSLGSRRQQPAAAQTAGPIGTTSQTSRREDVPRRELRSAFNCFFMALRPIECLSRHCKSAENVATRA